MTRGPAPLPIELKRLRGTFRADRVRGPLRADPAIDLAALDLGPFGGLLAGTAAATWICASDVPMVILGRQLADDLDLLRVGLPETQRQYRDTTRALLDVLRHLGLSPVDRQQLMKGK